MAQEEEGWEKPFVSVRYQFFPDIQVAALRLSSAFRPTRCTDSFRIRCESVNTVQMQHKAVHAVDELYALQRHPASKKEERKEKVNDPSRR